MSFLVNNGILILIAIVAAGITIFSFVNLFNKPSSQQIANLMEWLKFAVTNAESIYGSGTGQLKLRSVYDSAVLKFPWISKYVTFDKFSEWVDTALDWMKEEINKNDKIKEYVES